MMKNIKIWIGLVLICFMAGNTHMDPVYASTAHNQAEAVNWAAGQIGKSLDYDGMYGAQCVDLIKYYYEYLGHGNYAMGNACNYASNNLPSGWTRVYGNYQPGDIAVWKVNHSCSTCTTSSFGHVGIITSADSVGFNAVNQNFNSKVDGVSSCSQNWFRISALQCAIRPDFSSSSSAGSGNSSVSAGISYEFARAAWTDTRNAVLEGKVLNPSRLTVTNVGVKIWDSAGNLVVDHSEACGLKTSYVNQTLNIVQEAKRDGLHQGETYTFRMWAQANGAACESGTASFTIADDQKPVITDVCVRDISETGYTVHCTATDNYKISKVQFPTWTLENGQDDIAADWGSSSKCRGMANGSSYTFRVNISDHNNETGTYRTHIYAYDKAGNYVSISAPDVQIPKKEQEVQPIEPETSSKPSELLESEKTEETKMPTENPEISTEFGDAEEMAEEEDEENYWTQNESAPKKVTIRSLKKKKRGKFVVKYGRVSEADGYEISYNQGSRLFLSEKTTETSSLSKTVKNLKKGKKYYVRVRAYKWDSNGEKLYGPYSRVKRVKV